MKWKERAAHSLQTLFFSVQDYYIVSLKTLFLSVENSNPMTLFLNVSKCFDHHKYPAQLH